MESPLPIPGLSPIEAPRTAPRHGRAAGVFYPAPYRHSAVQLAAKIGQRKAAYVFAVGVHTVRRWRLDLGYPTFEAMRAGQ